MALQLTERELAIFMALNTALDSWVEQSAIPAIRSILSKAILDKSIEQTEAVHLLELLDRAAPPARQEQQPPEEDTEDWTELPRDQGESCRRTVEQLRQFVDRQAFLRAAERQQQGRGVLPLAAAALLIHGKRRDRGQSR